MSAARLAASFAAALLLVGCGKSDEAAASGSWPQFDQAAATPAPKAALPTACALVSAVQAEALLQQPVSPMGDEPENCIWASAGHPGQMTMLMVNLVQNEDLAMAQTVFQSLTGLQGDLSGMVNAQLAEKTRKSGQELDDLGEMDLIATRQIVARKGTVIFNLNITGMSKTAKLEGFDARLVALARTAVPQL